MFLSVAAILSLKELLPDESRHSARMVVSKLVKQLDKRLNPEMIQRVKGSIRKADRKRKPKKNEIDWKQTIYRNLKHYQEEYKTVIPHDLRGFENRSGTMKHLIILLDLSASMEDSVVYGGIIASILSSVKSLETTLIVFDTNVVDLSDKLSDAVDLLFGINLGGGTNINRALAYATRQMKRPGDTNFFLISDLEEGGSEEALLSKISYLKESGAGFTSILALSDEGVPSYNRQLAAEIRALDCPVFGCTPDQFPDMLCNAIEGKEVQVPVN